MQFFVDEKLVRVIVGLHEGLEKVYTWKFYTKVWKHDKFMENSNMDHLWKWSTAAIAL
jgi:hypothetical protein